MGSRTFTDSDVEFKIFHRRVEHLLDSAAETVNLELPLEDLLQLLREARGVIKADILAG